MITSRPTFAETSVSAYLIDAKLNDGTQIRLGLDADGQLIIYASVEKIEVVRRDPQQFLIKLKRWPK